jgi:hypothetical protein
LEKIKIGITRVLVRVPRRHRAGTQVKLTPPLRSPYGFAGVPVKAFHGTATGTPVVYQGVPPFLTYRFSIGRTRDSESKDEQMMENPRTIQLQLTKTEADAMRDAIRSIPDKSIAENLEAKLIAAWNSGYGSGFGGLVPR